MLSSFPLCLEWLPYTPGSLTTTGGATKANYVIVGTFLPEIEIWNLDELNALEPEFVLGGAVQHKKKSLKKFKQQTVPSRSTSLLGICTGKPHGRGDLPLAELCPQLHPGLGQR